MILVTFHLNVAHFKMFNQENDMLTNSTITKKRFSNPKLMSDELKKHSKFGKAGFTHFPTPQVSCSLHLVASSFAGELRAVFHWVWFSMPCH